MLSRVAETLYWTARYVERAENLARLVNVNNHLVMDLPKGVSPGWEPLIDITGSRELFFEHYNDVSEKTVLRFLTIDEKNPSSIFSALRAARDNTRTVREVMPRQVWEVINGAYLNVKESPNELVNKRGRFNTLKQVIDSALLVFGALDATLNHDHGYTLLRIGSLLERADMTSRIIDVRAAVLDGKKQDIPFENLQWMSVLRSLSAYQMYRQEMGVRIRPADVLSFMLHSEHFPRSVLFCVKQIKLLAADLPDNDSTLERIEHSIVELEAQKVERLEGETLHDYIDELQIDLAGIHTQLAEQYFLRAE